MMNFIFSMVSFGIENIDTVLLEGLAILRTSPFGSAGEVGRLLVEFWPLEKGVVYSTHLESDEWFDVWESDGRGSYLYRNSVDDRFCMGARIELNEEGGFGIQLGCGYHHMWLEYTMIDDEMVWVIYCDDEPSETCWYGFGDSAESRAAGIIAKAYGRHLPAPMYSEMPW